MIRLIALILLFVSLASCSGNSIVLSNIGHNYFNYQQNLYIDNSTACTKLYYSIKRVVQNCSSLNIAADFNKIPVKESGYVTELLLGNNTFRLNLPYGEINQYDSINLLDLSYNLLSEFTTDLQLIDCSANYLKELILNNNLFARLPLLNINCMNQLERLRLNNNKNLVNFDDLNTFSNPINFANSTKYMLNLKLLDVSYCSIEVINRLNFTILQYFPSLNYLNLFGNKIKFIYANPFVYTLNLNYLSFEANKLKCDSSIMWMKLFFSANKQILQISSNGSQLTQVYSPTCFSDLTQNNQTIINFDDSLFQTQIFLTTPLSSNSNLNVLSGSTVDLQCNLYSKPTSDLWWTFNERVLSRIVAPDSPYQFIENFNSTFSPFNKTSVLRIKSIYTKLAGNYSCKAYYLNFEPISTNDIVNVGFYVNVSPDPNQSNISLDSGSIAGIVIGSIVLFIILCAIIFLVIFCCCYKRYCCDGCCCCCYCCFTRYTESNKKANFNNYTSSNVTKSKKVVTEMEENASGFKDLNKIKPNYVSNTISKANHNTYQHNHLDSSLSWQGAASPTNNKVSRDYNNDILLDISHSNKTTNQQQQQALLDGLTYDETTVYNLNNTQNKRQQFQIYTIKHPIDYGSTYNTNEGYIINDPNELEQINTYLDHPKRNNLGTTTIDQYSSNFISSDQHEYHRNVASLTNELINTDSFKQKQYIYGTNNDFNNPSFVKYDSDV